MLVGYGRVSSSGQSLDIQNEALMEAGCDKVFAEKMSGTSAKDRIELANAIDFVREGDMVKVLDFGIAKLLGRAKTKTLTQGDFLGTPGYIAPETYADANRELTGKADVYGLGAVLFEAVSGQEPIVTAANPMVTLSSHLFTPPRRLRELAPEASPELEDLVARMLAKEPDARPTAREACEAMRAMLG